MHLSKRLEACLRFTEGFVKLADIGTDHAMLPIAAVVRGNVLNALAIDNKFGPYIQGRTNVKKYQVSNRVKVVLGDGISKIDSETDVVVISGMGGELITQILSSHSHQNVKRFVLQPNSNVPVVRTYITTNGYKIVDELVLADQSKLYEILVIEPGTEDLSMEEIEFGPINLQERPYYFMRKVRREHDHLQEILPQISNTQEQQKILQRIHLLEEVLHERN